MSDKTMAEVLAEHQYKPIEAVCSCSDFVQVGLRCDSQTHPEHVAEVLTAAGFGLVADAKAEAWDEAHFGSLGCDSSCCDYMHGAPEKDMNPYRTTP